MNINTIFQSQFIIGRDGKKYGRSQLHFDVIENFLKHNENLNQFLDQLYEIAQLH